MRRRRRSRQHPLQPTLCPFPLTSNLLPLLAPPDFHLTLCWQYIAPAPPLASPCPLCQRQPLLFFLDALTNKLFIFYLWLGSE